MSESAPSGRSSRTTMLGVLAVVIVVVPATWFGVRRWLIDDSAVPVPTDEVVAEFRELAATTTTVVTPTPTPTRAPASVAAPDPSNVPATGATTPPTSGPVPMPELPAPGVYRYTTAGFETVDALGGTRHDYPPETTITVIAEGCGVRLRWDVLRERREEWLLCATERGIEVQPESIQYHEFYGQGEEELVECARAVVVVAADPAATELAPVDQECFRVDEAWLPVWERVATTTLAIEGDSVDVTHVRQQVLDDDDHWEYTTIDWYLAPNGLPVRVVNVKESNSPTLVGDVVYTEEYELDLVSLTPIT